MSTHDHDPQSRDIPPTGSLAGLIDNNAPQGGLSSHQPGSMTSKADTSALTGAFPAGGDMAPSGIEPSTAETGRSRSRSHSRSPSTNTVISSVEQEERDSRSETTTSTAVVRPDRDGRTDIDVDPQMEMETVEMPPTTRTVTSVSGKPYSAFSSGTRWLIVTLAGIAAVFSPIRSVKLPSLLLLYNLPGRN